MSDRRLKRDDFDFELEPKRSRTDKRRGTHSRSRSRSRRHRRDSRSRSRSTERRRRRYRPSVSRSRSRSRGHSSRQDRQKTSRRYKDSYAKSKSRTRSRSHSKTSSKRCNSRSHSPHSRSRNDNHRRSRSSEQRELHKQEMQLKEIVIPRDQPLKESSNSKTIKRENTPESNSSKSSIANLKLSKLEPVGAYYNLDTDEPIDKERIHREIEEKLRQTLAKEGKVYPPPKPEATHPVFANDGSFIEIFKKMQEAQRQQQQQQPHIMPIAPVVMPVLSAVPSTSYVAPNPANKPPPPPPIVGRRRGGKILKTGVVEKQKAQTDTNVDPKDFWSLYLAEVNKYKNSACESDGGTRPLVK